MHLEGFIVSRDTQMINANVSITTVYHVTHDIDFVLKALNSISLSRRIVQPQYQLVANNVSPREKMYAIRGLEPATRYSIRVTAHNTAG